MLHKLVQRRASVLPLQTQVGERGVDDFRLWQERQKTRLECVAFLESERDALYEAEKTTGSSPVGYAADAFRDAATMLLECNSKDLDPRLSREYGVTS